MEPTPKSYLELIIGPMFSGKTSRLIDVFKQHDFCGNHPIVINFSGDNRYSDFQTHLSTHDERKIPCIRASNLNGIFDIEHGKSQESFDKAINSFGDDLEKIKLYNSLYDSNYPTFSNVILINEGQFFEDLFEWTLFMVYIMKKSVYIAGLDGDYLRKPIGRILELIPHSNKTTKLTSLCYNCKNGTQAIFSHRVTSEQEQIVIGSDNYIPLCRDCYIGYNKDIIYNQLEA
jgi:thymidine kinase